MATCGSMKAFNPQSEDWCTYEQRLKHYFIANGVTEAGRKRSILLTVSGTFKLLRSLSNNQQDTLSYADLVKLLKAHYNPKPISIHASGPKANPLQTTLQP